VSDEPSEDPPESPSEFGGTGPGSADDDAGDGGGDNDSGPIDETNSGVAGDASDDRVSDKSITEGSLIRPLFHLAWPIVVIQLLQVMYNVVDTLYLGRLSAEAVGAISLAFP